jgi:hypothetical protein
MHAPAPGRYRHFKGGHYRVLTLALHTETQEQLVIYQSEQDGAVYARPVAMFMEWIEHQGTVVSRFTPLAD